MGEKDIEKLMEINKYASKKSKKEKYKIKFEVDKGTYETAIVIFENGECRKPLAKENWDNLPKNSEFFCPDLLDFERRLIIEYEEEGGKKRSGARLATKGHGREGDFSNKRDTKRNKFYALAGFRILKIWESDFLTTIWMHKIDRFLLGP